MDAFDLEVDSSGLEIVLVSFLLMTSSFFIVFFYFKATPEASGSSQAISQIGAAALLHHSHSNMESELHLQPIAQLVAMLDT